MKTIESFQCEICDEKYDSEKKAKACELRAPPPCVAEVGEFVIVNRTYGWFDGDEAWIAERKKTNRGSSSGEDFLFYYLITKITMDKKPLRRGVHRWIYHLWTGAISSQSVSGWNPGEGHFGMTPASPDLPIPEGVIGKSFEELIY